MDLVVILHNTHIRNSTPAVANVVFVFIGLMVLEILHKIFFPRGIYKIYSSIRSRNIIYGVYSTLLISYNL